MPTPVGHALGGLAAAFLSNAAAPRPALTPNVLLTALAVAVAPDLDLLVGAHRTYTHSVGGVAFVALVAAFLLRRTPNVHRSVTVIAAAHASHLLLDWLGKDTSRPPGLMLLWPFSRSYYISGADLFNEVSRRYWLPEQFILGNLMSVAWELFLLAPLALVAWIVWSGRTIGTRGRGR